jgi:ribosomal protein L40E
MNISEIEIFSGKPDFEYEPIRRLEVKCEASNAFMPAPTIDEANGRLRALAAKLGANAIVEVDYNSGISFTSWKSLKAVGLAVTRVSDEKTCPFCAEKVRKAALKCRHCGSELDQSLEVNEIKNSQENVKNIDKSAEMQNLEPLTDNNNPAIVISLILVGFFVLMLLLSSN